MDKITTPVIVALIIGALGGYLFNSFTSNSSKPATQDESISETTSPESMVQPGSKEAKIAEAMSAAPKSVGENATILDFPEKEGGEFVELKKGTNDWTCLPDYPASPGKDPMCLDKQAMLFIQAHITKATPSNTQSGIAYMLAGGSDASNTDPFATKPTEGDDWITTPAHVMILPAQKLDPNIYGTDPNKGGSWIMWAGTPYEHLMVPVK